MDQITLLQEALRLSPDNLPLRKHLAATLFEADRYREAETEYRAVLQRDSDDRDAQLGLAKTFWHLGKASESSILLETLLERPPVPAEVHLFYARFLHHTQQYADAYDHYQTAVRADSSLADPQLANDLRLKLPADPNFQARNPAVETPGSEETSHISTERPKQTFADVGGMDAVKEEIRLKIIYPLQHAEMYRAYGKKIGGGILLYGPPGCGKTHLARATAGEVQASFISVSLDDILDMYIGNSEKNLAAIFEQARRQKPCVLFFDEVDALGANRTDLRKSGNRTLINQFLAELDGMDSDNDGLLILGATNAPWHLDNAFRRAGRFDRVIFVAPPDEAAREAILQLQLQGKPIEKIDYTSLARRATDYSGADLKAIVDLAVEQKLQEALRKGVPQPLTTSDLKAALGKHKPTTREWFATAKNYALYANESGLYDDILHYLKIKK
ncbi:Tetratricopeptide repeat-containing protein [Catalinimonas alkaloidigena]|uniref:Tetratricopeptide repeat-containing protein n=1 Tax=Catalinimonas alkaloidigena TaxID=1075417 RepID=A0A1G9T6F5_9BACT|nr:AAA family ATPase [Catalinimonas alkaloidigena]SDM43304.1 Tetratricopeptide repeat-containing protein [Catalinimonas alkaloidigena]